MAYAWFGVSILLLAVLSLAVVYGAYLLVGAFSSAPYVATSKGVRQVMLRLAGPLDGVRVLELGSGDGSLCLDAAQHGAIAYGIEINPVLTMIARLRARRRGLSKRTTFVAGDIWRWTLPHAEVVLVYLLPEVMPKISKLLRDQLPSGTVVVSHGFRFPDIPLDREDGVALRYVLP